MIQTTWPVLFERFAGRDVEIEHVRGMHARAVRDLQGKTISVSGDAGVGKSRFLSEVQGALGRGRGAFVRARCEELPIAYAPIIDALQTLGDRWDLRRVAAIAEALALLSDARPVFADAKERRAAVAQACALAMTEAARRSGDLVLVFEDVHWSDRASLEALLAIARAAPKAPLLLIISYRPEDLAGDFARAAGVAAIERESADRVALEPLSYRDIASLVRERVPRAPDAVLRRIYDISEGRPYVAEELTRSVSEGGETIDPGALLPLRATLPARLAMLEAPLQAVISCAAVLGRNFRPDDLFAFEASPQHIRAAMRAGRELQILEERDVAGEPWFRFRHALAREIFYHDIAEEQRRALHVQAANNLEQVAGRVTEYAYHVSAAGDAARGCSANECAGDWAHELAADSDAASSYARALEFAGEISDIARVGKKLIEALANVGEAAAVHAAAKITAERLAALGQTEEAFAVVVRAIELSNLLDPAATVALCEWAASLVSSATPLELRFTHEFSLAVGLGAQSRLDESSAAIHRARAILEAIGRPMPREELLVMRYLAYITENFDEMAVAREFFERRVRDGACLDAVEKAGCLNAIAEIASARGQHRTSFAYYTEAANVQEALGRRSSAALNRQAASLQAMVLGDFAYLRAEEERLAEAGGGLGYGLTVALVRMMRVCGGDPEPHLSYLEQQLGDDQLSFVARIAGDLAFALPGDKRIPPLLRRVFEISPGHELFKSDLLQAMVVFGEEDDARRAVAALHAQPHEHDGRAMLTGAFVRARAAIRGHRPLESKQHAKDAIELAGVAEDFLASATAHELAGDLAAARRVLHRFGATAELERLERRNARSLPMEAAILTRREEQVARAIASGLSSREVADRLAISARTVENHLANIYVKLGVNSRTQLVEAFASAGP